MLLSQWLALMLTSATAAGTAVSGAGSAVAALTASTGISAVCTDTLGAGVSVVEDAVNASLGNTEGSMGNNSVHLNPD